MHDFRLRAHDGGLLQFGPAGAGRREAHPWLFGLAQVLLWLVVISALISAAQYFRRFWSHVDDSIKKRRRLRMLEARKKPEDAVPL